MSSSYNSIIGTDTANTLIASGLSDDITAKGGDDLVTGVGNNDIISLGVGDDTLSIINQFNIYKNISVEGGAGTDSLYFNWGTKDSTIRGGSDNDSFHFTSDAGNKVYGDTGSDFLGMPGGLFKSSVYGGNLNDATSNDGDDSISLGNGALSGFINGNGGSDTIYFTNVDQSSMYGGQGDDRILGQKNLERSLTSSYITGNIGNDTIELIGYKAENTTIFGGGGYLFDTSNDGSDSIIIFNTEPYGISNALIHGNGGNDTLFLISKNATSGSYDSKGIYESSIYGGQGDDSIDSHYLSQKFLNTISNSLITGNLGNDTLDIGGFIRETSIYGGAGDNLINLEKGFDKSDGSSSNTYFFGEQTGDDTLYFGSTAGGLELTVAVEETIGNPSGFTFNSTTKEVSLGSGKTIYIDGYTGSSINNINSLGITFTTVSSSTITELG